MSRFVAAFVAVAALSLVCSGPAFSQGFKRTPIPSHHPLVGEWRVEVAGTNCHELRRVKPNGTFQVWAGEETSENEFAISASPGKSGFYKLVDKIVKDNGKPDCMGGTTPVGHVATNFILFVPSRDQFMMCEEEDTNTCFGTFIRQKAK
jgi:hypothetical protein